MINRLIFVLRMIIERVVFLFFYFLFFIIVLFPPLWVLSFPYWLFTGRDMMEDIFSWYEKNLQ